MKRTSWGCFSAALFLSLALALGAAPALAGEVIRPSRAAVVATSLAEAPPAEAAWRPIALPFDGDQPSGWYRIGFDMPTAPPATSAVYLPYYYSGGKLMLNGVPLLELPRSNADYKFRTERPYLLSVPATALRAGHNELLIGLTSPVATDRFRMPLLAIGPYAELRSDYEWRLFWVRTMPQFTVVACAVVGVLVLFIWWRRREELLYGLFGLATLLWGVRTLTFIIESLPTAWWGLWRLAYHSGTGGFIVVLLMFSLRLAGTRRPRLERALFGYWLLGPVGYGLSGGSEFLIGRVWSAGLIPIGMGILVMSALAAWRQRTLPLFLLSLALTLAVAAGVSDYLMASSSALLPSVWRAHRIFLLHYAADVLLLVMGGILSARFVVALQAVEQLNRTLESRVAERERALAENFTQMGRLERQHAADEERQRIMRDLHDGLGSQLFVTLSRAQAGKIEQQAIVQSLRDCIADMRLALEAMSPDGNDFLEAWGNFRFRWEGQLEAAGLRSSWKVEAEEEQVELSPHAGLQLLRIAQEALTNVLKHSAARHVQVLLRADRSLLRLEIHDDGHGIASEGSVGGRGLANMRSRAQRLNARLGIDSAHPGTRLWIHMDLTAASQTHKMEELPCP